MAGASLASCNSLCGIGVYMLLSDAKLSQPWLRSSPHPRHKTNCPKGKRSHTEVPRRATHLHIASPQGQSPFSILNHCSDTKKHRFRGAFICRKAIFDFYASCGSIAFNRICFANHKFGSMYLGIYTRGRNVSAGRGFFEIRFRKRGFEREAVRKTKFSTASKHRFAVLFAFL